jgi:hypothetical protein
MKRFPLMAACFATFALIGVAAVKAEEPIKVHGKAIVKEVVGKATYTLGAKSKRLKADTVLDPGTTITSGPQSQVLLSANGLSSLLILQPDTVLCLAQMDRIGSAQDGDTETTLDLKFGFILGEVKQIKGKSF